MASKSKKIRDVDEVFYLLLYMGVPTKKSPAAKKDLEGTRIAQASGNKIGIKIWPLKLTYKDKYEQFRYFFSFADFKRNDEMATRIAESVFFAATLVFGHILESDEEMSIFPVHGRLTKSVKSISIDRLIKLGANREADNAFLVYELSKSIIRDGYYYSALWKVVPVLFYEEDLFRACRFFKASQDNFDVPPGIIPEIIANPRTALTGFEQNRFEDALVNAFKSVEAVLGEPPKDDNKFFKKIGALNLDPNMEVGYANKEPLHTAIRNMHQARNKKAAHGATKGDRVIGIVELAEYQRCAQLVILGAIEKKIGHHIY